MNKLLLVSLLCFITSASGLLWVYNRGLSDPDSAQLANLNKQIAQEKARQKQLQQELDNRTAKLLNSHLTPTDNKAEAVANTNDGISLKEKAYQQALKEYEDANPKSAFEKAMSERIAENGFGDWRTNIESRYLPLLHTIGIKSPRLEQIIDLLVEGDQLNFDLRIQAAQKQISQEDADLQMADNKPKALLATLLTADEFQRFEQAEQQSSDNAALSTFKSKLGNYPALTPEAVEVIVDAFQKNRQTDDLYSSQNFQQNNVKQRVGTTLGTIEKMRSYVQTRLNDNDFEQAMRFFEAEERQYRQMEIAFENLGTR